MGLIESFVRLIVTYSLACAVAPRAEARALVGPGGLAVRWRSFVRVAGRRRTPPARRPRLAREGWPRARHRCQRVCSLESSCPSPFVRSFVPYVTRAAVGQVGVLTARSAPRQAAAGPPGILTRMARSLTLARWGTDGADSALTHPGAAGY